MGGSQRAGLGNSIPIFKVSQGTCPLAHVFRASPDTLPASHLFIRAPEVPARKRPIHTGLRAALFKGQIIHSGSTLPKDKAVSRRQYEQ